MSAEKKLQVRVLISKPMIRHPHLRVANLIVSHHGEDECMMVNIIIDDQGSEAINQLIAMERAKEIARKFLTYDGDLLK